MFIVSSDFRRLTDKKAGGIEVFTTELARGLAKEGVEVVYVIPNTCLEDSVDVEEGVKIYKKCKHFLDRAEKRIKILSDDLKEEDFV